MQELMLNLRLLNPHGLLDAVFLAGMFAAIVFKKESIVIPGMFRLAYWLFALSIILPACLTPALAPLMAQNTSFGGVSAGEMGVVFNVLSMATGPVLFALSLLCMFGSMFPRKMPPPPAAPTKHPLD